MVFGSNLIIHQEEGLYGAKDKNGFVIIPFMYKEMFQFSCGLSLVRNHSNQYAYINANNEQIVPFGMYQWCDPLFVCGFARVMKYDSFSEEEKWGIIDTLGNIIVPLKYNKIWSIKEEYIFSLKAFIGDKEEKLNLHQMANKIIFDGLKYIATYSVEAFKKLVNCEKLYVKAFQKTNQLFFTYGSNMGFVAINAIPEEPVVAIVVNSSGKIFPLLMEKSDIGKSTLPVAKAMSNKKVISSKHFHRTSFWDYEDEKMGDIDDWNNPYGDDRTFYNGWSKEDVESGLADAYECQ